MAGRQLSINTGLLSPTSPPMKQDSQIFLLDRSAYEIGFRARRRFLLLSIRRPGRHYARCPSEWAVLSRLDLMLHEWKPEERPAKPTKVDLQPRQAIKIVDWLRRFVSILSAGEVDLVIQSEYASPQAAAICRVIETVLACPVAGGPFVAPHRDTQLLLEMAMDASPLNTCSSEGDAERVNSQLTRLSAVTQIFHSLNVDVIVTPAEADVTVRDLAVAQRATEMLLTQLGVSQGSETVRDAADFVAEVMVLRRTRLLPNIPIQAGSMNTFENGNQSILLTDSAQLSEVVAQPDDWLAGSVHCFYGSDETTLQLKSVLLKRSAWLIDSPVEGGRLLSIMRRPDTACEHLHQRLRRR